MLGPKVSKVRSRTLEFRVSVFNLQRVKNSKSRNIHHKRWRSSAVCRAGQMKEVEQRGRMVQMFTPVLCFNKR